MHSSTSLCVTMIGRLQGFPDYNVAGLRLKEIVTADKETDMDGAASMEQILSQIAHQESATEPTSKDNPRECF